MTMRFLYVTTATVDDAKRIGRACVEKHLAACANILPGMQSIYPWEGKIVEDTEAVLILKTKTENVEKLMAEVKARHDYEVPCMLSLVIESGHKPYLDWLAQHC